ncbi:bifunctional protein GlmU [Oxobacter pfennigii]|uniref:Bifunctional protein GlmU n=1 Tax=Oxobacter pfennigii TaxID=36849 RepID=A0A0P8W4S2_9CLOT|nr:bifunctional UDP-N-acetylglucosamine diphosphorylase/glucosamine-1-phosphate N-acetyltransferase GlmU [Oxobacter pfennigii]KPU42801.1 bifunctional protein GlmU [Oxobacter pfennigii]
MKDICAVILAAGEGKRMKSKHSKVTHKLCGKAIIEHVIHSVKAAGIDDVIVVVGHKADEVKGSIKDDVKFALQDIQLGTGHAVMCAESFISRDSSVTLILTGDTPIITKETISNLVKYHIENEFCASILTADFDNPTGYGRIVRDITGNVQKITEQRDANEEELKIKEINSGIYCFISEKLVNALKKISNNNTQGEYYLTDVIEILKSENQPIGAFKTSDNHEIMGINSRQQLAEAVLMMRKRKINKLMEDGVTIVDPDSVYIDADVSIGMDTIIYPNSIIEGKTVIGEDCIIGPNSRIVNCVVHDGVEINNSVALGSEIKSNTHIGPFAYIRPECVIGQDVKIGDFVEVKKSVIGDGTKASHLSYIGDSEVGKNVNIGCGTVTVNYDGRNKHKTIIGDNVFVGCNANLVAPVKINDNSYVAAGSTITDEVPEGALAIAREKQTNKEGWVERKGAGRK